MKTFIDLINEQFDLNKKLRPLDGGTTGSVYTDGKYVYKKVEKPHYVDRMRKELEWLIDIDNKHVVDILDIKENHDNFYIVMEKLDEIDMDQFPEGELDRVNQALWSLHDDPERIPEVFGEAESPELSRMLEHMHKGAIEFSRWDIGFHNLMYYSKDDIYKIIDLN